ncbi:tol-pal system protein YbgF [Pelagibacterium lacus]|nr:tol-pal system protein YbgF [Pelagibacterium lacus]
MLHTLSALGARWRRGAIIAATAGLLTVSMTVVGQGQGNDLATLQIRLDQLEEQARVNSGQIEGLQFQLTQLQSLLERLQQDNEFRFQQLEGGGSGEADAAAPVGSESAAPASPQTGPAGSIEPQPSVPTVIDPLVGDSDLIGPEEMGDENNLYASDVFGESGPVLGAPEGPLGSTQPSAPLNLEFDPNATPLNEGDANAQYMAGYEAVVQGDYAFAENQFRQFVDAFPDHPQAPDATYWLGETLIQRGAYGEATEVLLTGFETYATSTRARDLLLNLGVALHGAGEFDTACRTYGEVLRRYPDAPQVFRDRVVAEQATAGC